MSEILAMHRRIDERLSTHNNLRIGRVLWSCDGHECPSYIASLATRPVRRHRRQRPASPNQPGRNRPATGQAGENEAEPGT